VRDSQNSSPPFHLPTPILSYYNDFLFPSAPNLQPDYSRTLDFQSDQDRHFLGALSRLRGLQSPTSHDMRVILEEAAGSIRASQLVRLENDSDAILSRRSNKRIMYRRATAVIIFFLGKGETVTKHLEPHKSLRSYGEDLSSERLLLRNSEDQLVRYSDAEFILESVEIAEFHVRPLVEMLLMHRLDLALVP